MKRNHILIAALALSSAGAFAAANDTSANVTSSSSRSYTASMPNDNPQVSQIQQALNDKGFNVGPVDGHMGPKTKAALKQFQQAQGLQASGKLDPQTVAALSIGASAPSAASEMSNTASTTSTPGTATDASSPNSSTTPNSSDTSGFSPQSPPPAQAK